MSNGKNDEPVVLGVVTRPHGVRGEVRVHRFNADSPLLLELRRIVVLPESGEPREVAVRSSKRSGDADVLALEGVVRVEDAEALRGARIGARREWMPALDEDEFYHVDLIGLSVRQGDEVIGEVLDVASYPSVDALRVRTERGVIEIPIIEPYVVRVDVASGTVEVAHTEDFEPER